MELPLNMHDDSCRVYCLVADTGGTTVRRQRSLGALLPATGTTDGAVGATAVVGAGSGAGCAYAAFVAVLCVVERAG